jgi:hypothetical protein
MSSTTTVDLDALRDGWRSLSDRLTSTQVARLTALERHPAYTGRHRLLLLEALEYIQPGWTAEYVAGRAASG